MGTIAVLSGILYRDNIFSSAVEHIFVGSSSGYFVYIAIKTLADIAFRPIAQDGKLILLVPVLLGVMLYSRYVKRIAWMSRWGTSFLVGVGSGLAIFASIKSQLIAQVNATMVPLKTINNVIMLVAVLSILAYFFFTFKRKGTAFSSLSYAARLMMMLTFGVSFGNVVMGRISLLLGVLQKLLGDWLGII